MEKKEMVLLIGIFALLILGGFCVTNMQEETIKIFQENLK
jgi:hypothetical protein